jgi:glycosyltransferase involved in cell wall biosynthesis
LRAMPAVCKKIHNALLVVSEQFADPGYMAALRRLAADLGVVDHVRFVGAIPYSDMPFWLNLADAVVMIPRSDGMPNTLLEAMSCGAVPILSSLQQYAEVIRHGENGFFVNLVESHLADVLINVLSDSGLRERIAQVNRDAVKHMADQDEEMSRMEDWYLRLAEVEGREKRAR